jgi:TolB-like protein/DNA-binding winged helix-turn-helix (wHTH) protein/Flp pilus assembly protein TadD
MSEPAPPASRVFRFDVFELDTHAGELRKRGVKLRLQGQPLQVLATLLNRPGDLVTREELRTQIWQSDTFVDFDHSLHNAIARLRETLGDSAESPRYIETLPRRGYRFIAPVDGIPARPVTSLPSRGGAPAGRDRIQSLAVLPLEDLSGHAGEDYFADSMTEAVITSLAKIKALRVISRTSAMQYKGARKSLRQIARELNVDAVLEGSVLRSDGRIRINAQLIHAATDHHLWAESYERDYRDILALQSEIAREVASQIQILLTPEERERLGEVRRINPEAHELYLKARYFWNKRTEENVRKALAFFRQAIDRDPTYAEGYVGLGDCYNILGYYNALPPSEAYPKGKAAALRALELDSSLAEAHASLGVVHRDFDWDWPGADSEFQRAIELNPNSVEAHHWRGTLLSMLSRPAEAIEEKNHALAIDPLSVVVRTDLARILYFARDYDAGLEQFHASLDMDPTFGSAYLWLANAYQQKGHYGQALDALKKGLELFGHSPFARARMAHGYAVAGDQAQARDALKDLQAFSGRQYVSTYDLALIHLGLGDLDQAFRCLHTAFEQRSLWLGYLNVEPQLDALRGDPRFDDLRQSVGLPAS